MVYKQLKIEGFNAYRWVTRWPEAFKDLAQWMEEVKDQIYRVRLDTTLKYQESYELNSHFLNFVTSPILTYCFLYFRES